MTVKYPHIKVQLTGKDGNAFFILGTVQRALRKHDVPETEIKEIMDKATSGDYDNLLRVVMETVDAR